MLDAVIFATERHAGQVRKWGGEPYILHCMRVAYAVEKAALPTIAVIAALLHDVLEDTATTRQEILNTFGEEITALVVALTDEPARIGGLPGHNPNRVARKAADRGRILKAGPLAQGIKLADIADNLPSIAQYDPGFAKVMLAEVKAFLEVTPSYGANNPYAGGVNLLYEKAYRVLLLAEQVLNPGSNE